MLLKELNELCSFWQKRLRLQDWKIVIKVLGEEEMGDLYSDACIDPRCKHAIIYLLDPEASIRQDAMESLEEFADSYSPEMSLVYELLSLHFVFCEKPNDKYGESALALIAEALTQLRKSNFAIESMIKIKAYNDDLPP